MEGTNKFGICLLRNCNRYTTMAGLVFTIPRLFEVDSGSLEDWDWGWGEGEAVVFPFAAEVGIVTGVIL